MSAPSPNPIQNLDELRTALQLAIGLELSTIPVYLTALYSIKEGHNTEAVQTIRSVVMEEMLHMTQAANVLNALGQLPSTDPVNFKGKHLHPVPSYPTTNPLASGIGMLRLLPFSPAAVRSFVTIEHPLHGASTLSGTRLGTCLYRTIGEFYGAIHTALKNPSICPNSAFQGGHQVPATQYYGGAGQLIEVKNRKDALDAITHITHEGEGLPSQNLQEPAKVVDKDELSNGWKMYSHYARFLELQTGRRFRHNQKAGDAPKGAIVPLDYDAVHPALHVPRDGDTEGGVESAALIEFDLAYTNLVNDLYLAFQGGMKPITYTFRDQHQEPHKKDQHQEPHKKVVQTDPLPLAVHGMYALKNKAIALMRTPSPVNPGHTLCPRFSYVKVGDRAMLREIATELRKENR